MKRINCAVYPGAKGYEISFTPWTGTTWDLDFIGDFITLIYWL